MKKLFLSLAALMMMTAPVMTSCSSDLDEVAPEVVTPETGTHVETLTITFPVQAETRVGVDDNNKLTGWDEGDEVTLVQTGYEKPEEWDQYSFILKGTYTFSCTDAAKGTFRGTLPNDVSVKDCQLAFYNATDFAAAQSYKRLCFSPKNRASQDMKDVVMLVAKNDGEGHFTMQIFGSILAVTNENNYNITASVKYQLTNDDMSHYAYYYDCAANDYIQADGYYGFMINYASSQKHTFTLGKNALTYVYLPVFNLVGGYAGFAVGVSAEGDDEDECSIVPFKTNPGNAKLFKKTLNPITNGKAKRTGNIDVTWVQLWKNGPRFAEYNVGVTDGKAESYGGYYCWGSSIDKDSSGAYKSGTDPLTGTDDTATNLWGSAWRMPTQAELQALLANCDVEWTTVNGVNGRKFTGKGDFDSNSVFLPAAGGCYSGNVLGQGDYGFYWSSTPNGSDYAYDLDFDSGNQSVVDGYRNDGYSVRAVLAE